MLQFYLCFGVIASPHPIHVIDEGDKRVFNFSLISLTPYRSILAHLQRRHDFLIPSTGPHLRTVLRGKLGGGVIYYMAHAWSHQP